MSFRRVAVYFPSFARGYLRNPIGLFMSLIFPVILILIFGAVFSNAGTAQVPLTVQNLDGSSPASQAFLAALNGTGAVSLSFVGAEVGNLSAYLAQHGASAGLVIPAGFARALANHTPMTIPVYTNPTAGSSSGLVLGAVGGVANGINLHLAGGAVVLSVEPRQLGSQTFQYIDYLIPGLIGFSILVSPMFSMVNISSTWRQEKLFRQLSLTPLTRAEWLAATLIWYILLGAISAVLLVAVGALLFGAHVSLTWAVLPFLLAGPPLFVSLGLLAGSVSSTPETAAVLGNVITFPMMFLSGTFFPVSQFPAWLQPVAHALPLYYVIDGLNGGMLFDNPVGALGDAVIVGVLALGCFLASTVVFRWREE